MPRWPTRPRRASPHWDDIEVRFHGRDAPLLRPRLHRRRAAPLPGDPRRPRRSARRAAPLRAPRRPTSARSGPISSSPPTASTARSATALAERVRAGASSRSSNRYTWLGTHRPFEAFTFDFQRDRARLVSGPLLPVLRGHEHVHRRVPRGDVARRRARPDDEGREPRLLRSASSPTCSTGTALLDNSPHLDGPAMWIRFPKVTNDDAGTVRAHVVLLGDAAATAHFSIGCGTKLALESAIALADKLTSRDGRPLADVLDAYEDERRVEVLRLQNAARNSTEWFESVELRGGLRRRSSSPTACSRAASASATRTSASATAAWLEGYERWLRRGTHATEAVAEAVPPMFRPVPAPRPHARQPRRRLADGDVLGRGRARDRLPPRPLRRARARRGRAGVHRDDVRRARRPHHAGLRRALDRRAGRGLAPHRRLRPRATPREDRAPTRPRRAQRARRRSRGRPEAATPRRWRRLGPHRPFADPVPAARCRRRAR